MLITYQSLCLSIGIVQHPVVGPGICLDHSWRMVEAPLVGWFIYHALLAHASEHHSTALDRTIVVAAGTEVHWCLEQPCQHGSF